MIDINSVLTDVVIERAKEHARSEYPNESCGIVFRGEYVPCDNIASDPTTDFEIASNVYAYYATHGGVEAVIHSHPGGPLFPTETDMIGQTATNVPWAIIPLLMEDDVMRVGDPISWGDMLKSPDLIGRSFIHGIHDCYSCIRETFALGKEKLAAQGVTDVWPFDPIRLPEFPRNDGWWEDGLDLYADGFSKAGFHEVQAGDVRAGDCFITKIRSDKLNHAGVLVTNDLILHHLPNRLSRREPAGIWGRQADIWVRYGSAK